MRALKVIVADDGAVFEALRAALSGDGPAILPRAGGTAHRGHAVASRLSERVPVTVSVNVSLVIETSGSTGEPKRVALSTDALLASAAIADSFLGGPGQWVLALPVHHIAGAGILVRSLVAETTPVVIGAGPFTGARFADAAEALTGERRYASLVPVQLMRLVDAAEVDARVRAAAGRMNAILVGGQAVPRALVDRARKIGLPVRVTYGSTETCGGCVYDGYPAGVVRVRERRGQLEIAGPQLAEGYLGEPERTGEVFHMADGLRWFRTGDWGSIDDRGRVVVQGRTDNMIISGGVKVSLDAVERAVRELALSPSDPLAHAVVVPEDSAEWGQTPVVVVELARDDTATREPDLAWLRDQISDRLGRASAPGRLVALDTMPTLASGKPDRCGIRALICRAR